MSCSTHDICQLYLPIPRNGKEQDFVLYFYPNNGPQSQVMRCEKFEDNYDYECTKDSGWSWEKTNSTHGLITLPTDVAKQPGNFKCQAAGKDDASQWSCLWSPVDGCPVTTITSDAGYSTTTTVMEETLSTESGNYENGDNVGLVVGLIVGLVLVVIVIIAIIAIMMFKKRRLRTLKSTNGIKKNGEEYSKTEEISEDHDVMINEDKEKANGMDTEHIDLLTDVRSAEEVTDRSISPSVSPGYAVASAALGQENDIVISDGRKTNRICKT